MDEAPKVKRLPPVVPVIQDRLTVSEENRSRLTESVEIALRFGKGKIAFIPAPPADDTALPHPAARASIFLGLALRALRRGYHAALAWPF